MKNLKKYKIEQEMFYFDEGLRVEVYALGVAIITSQ
jgi:hypothetical protein